MFDLVMSTIPKEEILKKEKSHKFCNPIFDQVVKCLDEEDSNPEKARYSST